MSILSDVVKELFGMFLADLRLAVGIFVLVGVVAFLLQGLHVASLIGAAVLVIGSLALLVEAAMRKARR
ncbi:hypothetical protein [Acuticoccus mangrovi]|uniref:Uncharacterized protein n=1 Tax=Acuticoccus mangrovi TaxID=2796142 RepID=A0A934IJE3_9HYPH|nr:hypothetical protein [Acuticoccus mangrovi]MBJ3774842.1 hypothetical protein [Acuticoccus mangrovi]